MVISCSSYFCQSVLSKETQNYHKTNTQSITLASYTDPPRPATNCFSRDPIFVKELITSDGNHRHWNGEALANFLNAEDRAIVNQIFLAKEVEPDKIVWSVSRNGLKLGRIWLQRLMDSGLFKHQKKTDTGMVKTSRRLC